MTSSSDIASVLPTLAEQLFALKEGARQRVGPERVATVEGAIAAMRAEGICARALRTGDRAPAVALPDALGRSVSLEALWSRGPVALVFYRGGWCPYCNLALRAWQGELGRLAAFGASLVAVSPLTPDNSLTAAQKNELAFPVLSDSSLQAAEAFGLAYTLPPVLVGLYQGMQIDIPTFNGNGTWRLPVPATYGIDRDGRIAFAHVEVDWRERAEPSAVIRALHPSAAQR
jgi:peroxiredoxin